MKKFAFWLVHNSVGGKSLVVCVFLFLGASATSAQNFKIPQQTIPVINQGFRTLVQVYTGDKTVKNPDNNRYYFWLKAKEIHFTQGGFEGDLLHGEYTVFYPSENLKEKGKFSMGLKTGVWKQWHDNGNIKEISNWNTGRVSGEVLSYNEQGRLVAKNNFKRGKLHGTQYFYTDSIITEKRYVHGREKLPKSKTKRKKVSKPNSIDKEFPESPKEEEKLSPPKKRGFKKWFKKKKEENKKPEKKSPDKKSSKEEKV